MTDLDDGLVPIKHHIIFWISDEKSFWLPMYIYTYMSRINKFNLCGKSVQFVVFRPRDLW